MGPAKVAVYVDGCFWHRCPEHRTTPKANAEFWDRKLTRNQERDVETDRLLDEHGWAVVRIWEHEDPAEAADRVESLVRSRLERKA
jgi:DNA mismatch endonuclease, patch repair protein